MITKEKILEILYENSIEEEGNRYIIYDFNFKDIASELEKQCNIDSVSKRIFLVEFNNYISQKEYKDCFIAINETDVAQQIRVKHKDNYTSYQIVDSYVC